MNVWYTSTQNVGIRGQQNINSFEKVPMRKPPTSMPSMQRDGVKNFVRYI